MGVDGKKVPVIHVLRERMGLRLSEAHGLIQAAPTRIGRNLEPGIAEQLRDELEAAGATVEMQRAPKRHLRPVP